MILIHRLIFICLLFATAFLSGCTSERPVDSVDVIIDDLVTGHVLDEVQRPTMIKYLKGRSSPSHIIRALTDVLWEDGHERSASDSISLSAQRQIAGIHRKGYSKDLLSGLHDSGIITDKMYRRYFPAVQAGYFVRPLVLLRTIQYEVDYGQMLTPGMVSPFADSLYAAGVVSESRYAELKEAIADRKIDLRTQLLDYTVRGVRVDLYDYPQAPKELLTRLYTSLAALFPELAVTDFVLVLADTVKHAASGKVRATVSFKVNHVAYRSTTELYKIAPEAFRYNGYLVAKDFYQVFNQVLIDAKSPYRLHYISDEPDVFKSSPGQHFGIQALTKPQQRMLHRQDAFFATTSDEVFEGKLSITEIPEAMNFIGQLGITAHLTQQQIDSTGKHIERERPATIGHLLSYYPDVVYTFDYRVPNSRQPYSDILLTLSRISHGAFRPSNIHDEFVTTRYDARNTLNQASFSFSLGGKIHTRRITISEDVTDPTFPGYIFEIVEGLKLPGHFYDCFIDDKAVNFIYLKPRQAEALAQKYALPLIRMPSEWRSGY